jgi:acyl-coenzyme A thioesterase 13
MTEPGAVRLGLDEPSAAQRLIGFAIEVGADGQARCRLDVGPEHLNRHGVLHGGFTASVLDTAMGAAASLHVDPEGGGARPVSTITMTVQFQAPMHPGRLTAEGRVTGGGRRTLFLAGEARDETGRLIASAVGTYKPVQPHP